MMCELTVRPGESSYDYYKQNGTPAERVLRQWRPGETPQAKLRRLAGIAAESEQPVRSGVSIPCIETGHSQHMNIKAKLLSD
ncbi:hypothetical protein [Alteribacter natronophilus]|uniref:hypothetical protein n=1 Tax=Alteribacter natronophilus TaxID=2583810 RepID=UPI00110F0CC2|nr:hypothetical protein [Alteribacter natronophilus]TMW71622.1 hypothetical protein FGB90_11355 [Alteribacter natronophilus]